MIGEHFQYQNQTITGLCILNHNIHHLQQPGPYLPKSTRYTRKFMTTVVQVIRSLKHIRILQCMTIDYQIVHYSY